MGAPHVGPDDALPGDTSSTDPTVTQANPIGEDGPAAVPEHPLVQAIGPLLERIGATFVDPLDLRTDDVPLEWANEIIGGIRLAATTSTSTAPASVEDDSTGEAGGGLEGIIVDIERFFGTPLAELPRARKQQAVRMFEEGGAFSYRKSVEAVAAALGISRFTVYNYLNRDRD